MIHHFLQQYFGHAQRHPLLQFVDNVSFCNLALACKFFNDLSDEWKKYFRLTGKHRRNYLHVCGTLGIIPIMSMMEEHTFDDKAVQRACANGHANVVCWMFEKKPFLFSPIIFCIACLTGNLEFAQWCYNNKLIPNQTFFKSEKGRSRENNCMEDLINAACENGHLHILEFLFEKRDIINGWSISAINYACSKNRFETVKWIHQHFPNLFEHPYPNQDTFGSNATDAIDAACFRGNLELAQWLHNNLPNWGCTSRATKYAAMGHLDLLIWLDTINAPFTKNVLDIASENGCIDIVNWIIINKKELPFTGKAIDLACKNGHLEIAKKIFNELPSCKNYTTRALDGACKNGHWNVMQWLYNEAGAVCDYIQKVPLCTTDAMDYAATNGHFEILKWLRSVGAVCSKSAINGACMNGRIDIVKWLCDNKCVRLSSFCSTLACANKQFEVFDHLCKYTNTPIFHNFKIFAQRHERLDIIDIVNDRDYTPDFSFTKNDMCIAKHINKISAMRAFRHPTAEKEINECYKYLYAIHINRKHNVKKPDILKIN